MRLLAIETSTGSCSTAVLIDDGRTSHIERIGVDMQRGHAEAIFPMIREVMHRSSVSFAELDRIAVSVGPGSFTGTRVGISAARGLALATTARLVGATSLAIIAAMVTPSSSASGRHIAVALSAGRGDIYFQLFSPTGAPMTTERAIDPDAAAALLPPGYLCLAGNAAPLLQEAAMLVDGSYEIAPVAWPDAAALATLARTLPDQSALPVPLYLRPADAKPQHLHTLSPLPTGND